MDPSLIGPMPCIKARLSALYARFAETPELSKFHRHLDLWSWVLNNQNAVIAELRRECDGIIAEREGIARVFLITDYHWVDDDQDHPLLKTKIKRLTELLRQNSMCIRRLE